MLETRLQQIERQLVRLERQNRRYRFAGALTILAALALVTMGQSRTMKPAKVVEAEKFVLRDSSGIPRGIFTVESATGVTSLALADKTGKAVIELISKENGETALVFADSAGTTRAALGVKGGNSPDLGLADASGVIRVSMGIDAHGHPTIVLYDEKQNAIWKPIWRKP